MKQEGKTETETELELRLDASSVLKNGNESIFTFAVVPFPIHWHRALG